MRQLTINNLRSGGIITNYYCTSRCKHCLYGCSPKWEKEYITADTATILFRKVRSLGCTRIHIGGGEPFLNPQRLFEVCRTAKKERVSIEYIETNSSWYRDKEQAAEILKKVRAAGVRTLLVSISPFHNEFIPFKKVKGVMVACQKSGIIVFPWVTDFIADISTFDENAAHSLDEYTATFGSNYLSNIPGRYWLHYGGRAVETYKKIFPLRDLEEILSGSTGCRELADTSHFHFDLFENYIPGLCSGLAISGDDMGTPLDPQKYPFLTALYDRGIEGLFTFAQKQCGFVPESAYLSKCHLCMVIRKFLVIEKGIASPELRPVAFYHNVNNEQE